MRDSIVRGVLGHGDQGRGIGFVENRFGSLAAGVGRRRELTVDGYFLAVGEVVGEAGGGANAAP